MNIASKTVKSRVVILGGGNGTSRLLYALLPLLQQEKIESLYALVHVSDDGGSTGRLREQYGVPAVGDLTKSLMALSALQGDLRGSEFIEALNYRFESGDFMGHTVRNIFLAALEKTSDPDIHGASIDAALATMARVLQVPKRAGVVPTTLIPLTEQVVIKFGGVSNLLGEGQHSISHRVNVQADPRWRPGDVRVQFVEGDVPLNPRAEVILREATHIVIAPGHTYGTILPTLALPALGRLIKSTAAPIWVVETLLTTPRQTEGWSGEDFVRVYESYFSRPVQLVIGNSGQAEVELVAGQKWVKFSEKEHRYELIEADLVNRGPQSRQRGDVVPRAVVVHGSAKVGEILEEKLLSEKRTREVYCKDATSFFS